jgi:hypothetical protein
MLNLTLLTIQNQKSKQMGAHVILISVENEKAISTTIPMRVAEEEGLEYGDKVRPNAGFMKRIDQKYKDFVKENPDALMESDAHGQLSADLVLFDVNEERGYRFDYSGF